MINLELSRTITHRANKISFQVPHLYPYDNAVLAFDLDQQKTFDVVLAPATVGVKGRFKHDFFCLFL